MIDGSEKRNRQLAFERQNSHVCEKRSKLECEIYKVLNDFIGPKGGIFERQMEGRVQFYVADS